MLIKANIDEYARGLARDCAFDSGCAFVSDKTSSRTRLYHLGNHGVSEEVLDRYWRKGICDADPFTDIRMQEEVEGAHPPRFHAAGDPALERIRSRTQNYWDFVAHEGIEVIGASTLRLLPQVYLIFGVHRNRSVRGRGAVPLKRLADGMDILLTRIAAGLLSSLLEGGRGYRSLLHVVQPRESASPCPTRLLSMRENDVARLVCMGKQNKEIAFMTSLAECTVENHLRRIYRKLGIRNRAALVAKMHGVP